MIGGKTIISEEVFADLVKTAMSKVGSVAVSTGEGSALAVIAKKVAERVVPQVNVKRLMRLPVKVIKVLWGMLLLK